MKNEYYENLKFVANKVEQCLTQIFKVYGNELLLRLEDYNLLKDHNNCIETSTATGFIMEEFITSKLAIYTQGNNPQNDIVIKKSKNISTVNTSYDCYVEYKDIFIMINIKVQKEHSNNCGVAAINILHRDYMKNIEQKKAYLLVKTLYNFDMSSRDNERKIFIRGIEHYYLEEIDFSTGHRQDYRNWSKNFNLSSGRLKITPKDKRLNEEGVCYKRTLKFIDDIYNGRL